MPELDNPKREQFAQAYAETANILAAYRKTYGYNVERGVAASMGARMLRDADIGGRVAEICAKRMNASQHVFEICQDYAPELVEHLIQIVRDGQADNKDRIKASELILDRGLGKAVQTLDINKTVTHYVIEAPRVASSFDHWLASETAIEAEAIEDGTDPA